MATRFSARILGSKVGLTAQEVNKKLHDFGLLDGEPGGWRITEKGKEYSNTSFVKTSNGQGCARGYDVTSWDGRVLKMLKIDKNNKKQ